MNAPLSPPADGPDRSAWNEGAALTTDEAIELARSPGRDAGSGAPADRPSDGPSFVSRPRSNDL
jgi:hypothetical protein